MFYFAETWEYIFACDYDIETGAIFDLGSSSISRSEPPAGPGLGPLLMKRVTFGTRR